MQISGIYPQWLKSVRRRGLDQLGLQILSITMYSELLPGLTNVTDRIRYYSFYPWLLYRYAKDVSRDDLTVWQQHLRRAEFLLALISKAHHRESSEGGESIVGADRASLALKEIADSPSKQFQLSRWTDVRNAGAAESYFKNKNGGFGQYYRGVLDELGVLAKAENGIKIKLIADCGEEIANICDDQPQRSEFWSAVLEDSVTLQLIEELGDGLCPCCLSKFDQERDFLRNLAFGPDYGTSGNNHRSSNLLLLLSQLMQCNGVEDPVEQFRETAYYGLLGNGDQFIVAEDLEDEFSKWRIYQASELIHFSLENAFYAALQHIKDAEPAEKRVAGCLSKLATSSLSSSSNQLGLGTDQAPWANRTLGELIDDARQLQLPLQDWRQDPWAEWNLKNELQKNLATEQRLAFSFACLISVVARQIPDTDCYSRFESLDVLRYPHNWNSLKTFLEENHGTSAVQVLEEILSDWCIGQHMRVAMRKLRGQQQSTFKLALEEGSYVWLDDFQPTFTSPRLRQTFTCLRDLGLCDGFSNEWRVSQSGVETLRQFHVS